MVRPGKKYTETYMMTELTGNDLLVLRSDEVHTQDTMAAIDAKLRAGNPKWAGVLLVLRTDQSIERMPEEMARDLYHALKLCFERPDVVTPTVAPPEEKLLECAAPELFHTECRDCDAFMLRHRAGRTHCACGEEWPCSALDGGAR